MEFLLSFGLSLVFGLFWMWWFYRLDVFDKEPKRFVAFIFVLSMPLSVLAGLLQYSLDQGTGLITERSGWTGFLTAALFNLFVVAVIEELAKFFVVFTVAYPNRAFNESVDGIIYAAAAALGFATFENLFYGLDRGPLVLLLRGPFTTLGHVLFSALWGAALGRALHEPNRRRRTRMIMTGLFLSMLTHGTYNILISLSYPYFGQGLELLAMFGAVFLGLLYLVVLGIINQALHISVFNPRNQTRAVLHLLRERRRQHQEQIAADQTEIASSLDPTDSRYAPNPHRYQFRGQTTSKEASEDSTEKK